MDKLVTLVANTAVPYGGRLYGAGMQFTCDEASADALVKSQQASRVSPPPDPSPAKADGLLAGLPKIEADPKK